MERPAPSNAIKLPYTNFVVFSGCLSLVMSVVGFIFPPCWVLSLCTGGLAWLFSTRAMQLSREVRRDSPDHGAWYAGRVFGLVGVGLGLLGLILWTVPIGFLDLLPKGFRSQFGI